MEQEGRTGPKFSDTEREGVIAKVAEMDRRGYTQWDIANAIHVSQCMVSKYLKQIRAEYNSRRFSSIDANREEKRAQYGEIRRVAWEQYEKCIEGEVTVTDEHEMVRVPKAIVPDHLRTLNWRKGVPAPKTHEELEMRLKRTIIRSSSKRGEAAQYLAIIMKCLDAEREMDGLVSKMVTIVPQQPTLDWDALLKRPNQAPLPTFPQGEGADTPHVEAIADKPTTLIDEVERKIAELEAMPPILQDSPPSGNGNGQAHP